MTADQEHFIVDHWNDMSCEALRKRFNAEFGTSYKTTAFHYHTKRLGLSKHIEHKYTEEQDAFLRANSDRMTKKELTDAFNEKYRTAINEQAIVQHCFLRGWKSQSDGRFKVGDVPWCKSEGGREAFVEKLKGGNSGSFQKGHVPHNRANIGAIKKWGHELKIKTEDGWKNRLRHMWEQAHGKIPNGYVVISVDGDPYTNDVSHLRLISNKTLTFLIANKWNGKGAVIIDTGIMWCELKNELDKQMGCPC